MFKRVDILGPDIGAFCPARWVELRPGWGFLASMEDPESLLERKQTLAREAQEA